MANKYFDRPCGGVDETSKKVLTFYPKDDLSEAGAAELFVKKYRQQLLFCPSLGWLVWDGKRFAVSDTKALGLATAYTKEVLAEATEHHNALFRGLTAREFLTADQKDAEDYLKYAKRLRKNNAIKNVLSLAAPPFEVRQDDLDVDPFALCTPGGVIDLRTGQARKHDPNDRCTKITAVSPSKDGAKRWQDFLRDITLGDDSLRGFLQMLCGMAAIGKVYHEGIVIATGEGSNGKSTFFNVVSRALGDYAGSVSPDILMANARGNVGANKASLRGKRLVVAAETQEGERLSTAVVKQLSSRDRLVGEVKFKAPEEFSITHTLVMFTNHLPRTSSTDYGTWRRLTIVPFKADFTGMTAIPDLEDKLFSECGGAVLDWVIEGAGNFIRNGYKLTIPDAVELATDEYRTREDWLNNFFSDCCEVADPVREDVRTQGQALQRAYREWAQENNEYVRRGNDLAEELRRKKFRSVNPSGRKYWLGIKLNDLQYR